MADPPKPEALPSIDAEKDASFAADSPLYDMDLSPDEEDEMWRRFNAAQLLKHYNEADAIYDTL